MSRHLLLLLLLLLLGILGVVGQIQNGVDPVTLGHAVQVVKVEDLGGLGKVAPVTERLIGLPEKGVQLERLLVAFHGLLGSFRLAVDGGQELEPERGRVA